MRILLIRHGDPDYEKDSLTERGWKEAELLAQRLAQEEITDFYVSPLGRAKDTASLTLRRMNQTAQECEWLREFQPRIWKPYEEKQGVHEDSVVWDWLPSEWTKSEEFFRRDQWYTQKSMTDAGIKEEYDWVVECFDAVLKDHGYVRKGDLYQADWSNRETLVFFCHFGVSCVILSHLLNVSPMVLWHGLSLAPSSVTTLYTEERRRGVVLFRASAIGDTSHLYAGGMKPAFAARFCEIYDSDERHD